MSQRKLLAIDGHTFDPLLVPPGSWALDAGCRGFALSRYLAGRGVRVLAIDADPDVRDPRLAGVTFLSAALLAERDVPPAGTATLFRFHDNPEAHTTRWGPAETGVGVRAVTLRRLMLDYAIRRFALVKLDVEGSEYGIVEELAAAERPFADQISVEYHDFCHMSPTADDPQRWHVANLARLARAYRVARHVKEPAPWGPPGAACYLDSLYVAKACSPAGSLKRAAVGGTSRRVEMRPSGAGGRVAPLVHAQRHIERQADRATSPTDR